MRSKALPAQEYLEMAEDRAILTQQPSILAKESAP
jgi:hypothetical protein